MKATAMRVDISQLSKVENSVPQIAVVTATIKFQLNGSLITLYGEGMTKEKQERKLGKMLLDALRDVQLD